MPTFRVPDKVEAGIEIAKAKFDLWIHNDNIVSDCVVVIALLINEVLTLKRTIILLEACVECNVKLAILVGGKALRRYVNVSIVVETVKIPDKGLQHFGLGELSQDTLGLPVIVCWLNHKTIIQVRKKMSKHLSNRIITTRFWTTDQTLFLDARGQIVWKHMSIVHRCKHDVGLMILIKIFGGILKYRWHYFVFFA